MAKAPMRRKGELVQHLFRILQKHPDGLKSREALNALAESEILTEYEAGSNKSGGRRFETILRFATHDTARAGWLHKEKDSVWTVTEEGLKALTKYPDPEEFQKEASRRYREWDKLRKGASSAFSTQLDDNSEEIAEESEAFDSVLIYYLMPAP